MFDFPGDLRGGVERVPQLPEIENQENREPLLYTGREKYYGGQSLYSKQKP